MSSRSEWAAARTSRASTTSGVALGTDLRRGLSVEAEFGDRHSMVWSGTSATYGHSKAIGTTTGLQTEMSRIAGGLASMTTRLGGIPGATDLADGLGESAERAKEQLRAVFRERQGSLSSDAVASASGPISDSVLRLPEVALARSVLLCLSFGSEIDTWKLTERLLESGRRVYVPRAEPRDRQLHVHPYPCPLRTLSFGLKQPPRGTPELDESEIDAGIDVALVLGLAFDRRGFRLGHGSGYFDRFLSRHPVFAVGLTHSAMLVESLPIERHDLPMSVLVSEHEVARAGAGGDRAPSPRS